MIVTESHNLSFLQQKKYLKWETNNGYSLELLAVKGEPIIIIHACILYHTQCPYIITNITGQNIVVTN